ncbi:MAG: hypothetical protein RBR96_04865 [Candidatus Izemoplasmatales bacterium]|nr:hypothetical protein [Candidatus Izemoplasmatales bacterium]
MKKLAIFIVLGTLILGLIGCNAKTTAPSTNYTTALETTDENSVVLLADSHYQYSTFSTENIKILHLDISEDVLVYDIDMNELNKDDILFLNNQKYEIKSTYILNQTDEIVEFYLESENQRTLVKITKSDKEVPYIISSTLVVADGTKDLSFQFELFGGSVKQISAIDLTEDDYEVVGNILTINKEYVSELLETEEEFIINYALETNELVIGFISVSQE